MDRRLFVVLVIGLGLLITLLIPQPSLAETGQWSRPVLVSGFEGGSEFPALAVDGSENVHIIWTPVQGRQSYLFYSRWDGEAWSRPVDIRPGSDRALLAVDRYGDLNLVYVSGGKAAITKAQTDQAASMKGWVNEHLIHSFASTTAIQMAIDDQGVIHVVRTQNTDDCGTCADIVYQQSLDGGISWSENVKLSNQPADRRRVDFKIDSRGTLHAAWDGLGPRGSNQSVRYSYSKDHGKSWALPQQFFGPKAAPTQAALGIGANDQLILVWQTIDRVGTYFQVSNDSGITWGQASLIPGLEAGKPFTGNDRYDMTLDSAGIVHLAAVGRGGTSESPWLYHLQWDGKTWSKPAPVYSGPDIPEYPIQVVSGGNHLHMTWSTRAASDVGASSRGYGDWYSSLVTSAPALTPLPTFTPAPPVNPTAHPTETRTATATPPSFSGSNPGSSADRNPGQQQFSVLAGIIPVLLIIGIVVVLRLRPRRQY